MSDAKRISGIGLMDLLLVLFVGLKLGGVINWSWWWVLSPIWIPLILLVIVGIIGIIVYIVESA